MRDGRAEAAPGVVVHAFGRSLCADPRYFGRTDSTAS